MGLRGFHLAQAFVLFVGFFGLYAVFRSPDLMAVDGPPRSCQVYHRQEIFFHGNNHLLYPVNVLMWNRLLQTVVGQCEDPLDFARRTALMNGFAAAASVAIIFLLVRGATSSNVIAIGAACAYGFSRALLLHATNAAEPPVGLLLSFLAVGAAAMAGKKESALLAALAGVLLAAAMATYQTMILVGPAALLLCAVRTTDPAPHGFSRARGQAMRVIGLFVGSAAGVALIYGWAYTRQGINGIGALLRRFFTIDGGTEVYGGLSVSKAINTPIGLIGNFFYGYPPDYAGVRWLLRNHATDGWAVWLLILLVANATGAVALACLVRRHWESLGRLQRVTIAIASVGLAFTLAGPIYWTPTYDKLLLQPIAAIVVLVGLALSVLPPSDIRRAIRGGFVVLVVTEVVSNCIWLIPNVHSETPYLQEARQVHELLRPDDLLVSDWDGVSVLWGSLYGFGQPQLCLPTAAHDRGPAVFDDLREMIRQAKARGASVYFLGIMDQTEAAWQAFLGDRVGVPYHAFDEFRNRCRPVASFTFNGNTVTLQLFEEPGH